MSDFTIPWRETPVDQRGQWTPAWILFLNELAARIGGSGESPDLSQLVALIENVGALADFQSVVPQDTSAQEALRKIAELEAIIPPQPDLSGFRRKLEELEGVLLDLRPVEFPRAGDWIAPTLLNSWVNFGGGFNNAGYCKDPFGVVRLRGMVKSGIVGNAIFSLPAGYRPASQELLTVTSNGALGRVDVYTTGDVGATTGNNAWFSLDGLTFRAA